MPPKNPRVDYLRVYPGLNDFSDALEAIPDTAVGYLTNIKQVLARTEDTQSALGRQIKSYFVTRDSDELKKIDTMLDTLLPAMDEKMRTAVAAAEQVGRQIERLNSDFDMIRQHEVPKLVQYDFSDPAFYEIVPQDKMVNARTQARREAREARESRRVGTATPAAESRAESPVQEVVPPPSRRRGRTPQVSQESFSEVQLQLQQQREIQLLQQQHEQRMQEQQQQQQQRMPPAPHPTHRSEAAEDEKPRRNDVKRDAPPAATPSAVRGSNDTDDGSGEVLVSLKRKRGAAPKSSEPVYCYCQKGSFGEMVGCDGTECEREWFHLGCIGLSALPKGQWFCEECRAKLRRR